MPIFSHSVSGNAGTGWPFAFPPPHLSPYAHCFSICVTVGQQVQAGQVIAYVGHTERRAAIFILKPS